MEIRQKTVYGFSFFAEGIGFNFDIPAANQEEAILKLRNALQAITKQLEPVAMEMRNTKAIKIAN